MLRAQETVLVKDIARELDVTEMTVRRDLEELRVSGIVTRSYGKASLIQTNHPLNYEYIENIYSLSSASNEMNEEKTRIAQYAVGLIQPGDVVILDNGSTTDKIADYMPSDMDLTVACYNLNILVKLPRKEQVKIIFAGGYFHPSDQMFESPENIAFLRNIRANKLFLSASGIHERLGLTCAHSFEVAVKQAVLQSALTKILVADSSKFGAIRTVFFAQMDEVDMIITDTGLSDDWVKIIQDRDIRLVLV